MGGPLLINGKPRRYTYVGGYPLMYVLDGCAYCVDCTCEGYQEEMIARGRARVGVAVINWENDLCCEECGAEIERADE